MKTINRLLIIGLMTSSYALSNPTLPKIPSNALGVIQVEHVKIGSLVMLKGMKGTARYITYDGQGTLCEVSPIEFLAGGFSGDTIGIENTEDIVMSVYSTSVAEHLMNHKEVTSEDYQVALMHTPDSDVVLESGLTLNEGFILHPRSFWSSWWHFDERPLRCTPI